jgi:D-alanyl-lipoteichoic acid acyltransferase DltB (MBOAT superfamily)
MLFNSTEFILVFMPITLLGFLFLRGVSRDLALGWLIMMSLGFYAWWRPLNVFIIVPSIVLDFAIARCLLNWNKDSVLGKYRKPLLITGIVVNLAVLGYFKYTTFFLTAMNQVAGTDFVITYVVLPLGISFITFQKIAFLIDVHGGRLERFSFRDYCLFILFFPQLIAGPIVHFREMIPQFQNLPPKLDRNLFAAGIALFTIGLFKKVVLADRMAEYLSPIYSMAGSGDGVSLIMAWLASLGFTMQIYFDFSGYSDMAAGLALCIGVRLPLNFDSPLKATSIIDFWNRWHITLTHFLTAYIYNPLTLAATRNRIRKGKSNLKPNSFSLSAFLVVLAAPTMFTMFVSGLWHGAGYLFILWGLLHGLYLVINHAWRRRTSVSKATNENRERMMKPIGFVITFVSVAVAMVIFRAPDVAAAADILRGMIGLNGLVVPENIYAALGGDAALPEFIKAGHIPRFPLAFVCVLLVIALLAPNSMEITARYEPTLGVKPKENEQRWLYRLCDFKPTIAWGFVIGGLAIASIAQFGGPSEFLYWQF